MKIFQRYKEMNITMRATVWYLICNVLQKGIQFFTIPLYLRLLSTEEYGNYSVFLSWRDILIIPITLNLYCGIFTKAMVDYDKDRDRYTSSMQGLSTLLTMFFFLIYIVLHNQFHKLIGYKEIVSVLLFLYYLTFPAYSFWTVRQRVENKYKRMVILTLLISLLTPIVSVFLLYITNMSDEAIIIGTLGIQIIFGAIFYVRHFIRSKEFFNKKYWIHALRYNIPLIPHYLSLIVLAQADRIMIKDMCGADKAGIYSVAYQISAIINVVVAAVNSAVVPWLYEKFKTESYDIVKRVSNSLCVIMAAITSISMLIAPEIVHVIGPDEYGDAIWIIPAVTLSAYLTYCNGFFTAVEFYYSATKYVMIASSIGAIVNIVLNYYFINIFGYIAAGYTTLVCYTLFFLAHYYFMRKICNESIKGIRIYNEKNIMAYSLMMFLTMFVCLFIYENILIRYLLCIVLFSGCFVLRNKIKKQVIDVIIEKQRRE